MASLISKDHKDNKSGLDKAKDKANQAKDFIKDKLHQHQQQHSTMAAPITTTSAPLTTGTTTTTGAPLMAGDTTTSLHSTGFQQHAHHISETETRVAEQKLVLAEEKLVVNKREQEAGGIDIEKRVDLTTAQVPVTLEREVVSIERRPLSGTAALSSTSALTSTFGKETEIVATVHADQAIATKRIAPTEQVRVDKHRVAEQKLEQAAVRSEHVEVLRDVRDVDAVRWAGSAGAAKVTHGNIMGPDGRVVAYEEQLAVGKERVAAGQVAVQKRVDTRTAAEAVTLESDEVHVTREPVSGNISAPSTLVEGSAHIGLKKEVAQVGTVVVPKEEIVLRKGVQVEQHTVQAELAREHIQVKPSGAIEHRQGCSLKGCTDKSHLHDQEHLHASGFQSGFQSGMQSSGLQSSGLQTSGLQSSGFTQPSTTQPGTGSVMQHLKADLKAAVADAVKPGGTTTSAPGHQLEVTPAGNVRVHH